MRDIRDVIIRMNEYVPHDHSLKRDFKSLLSSVSFSAPENIGMWWEELSNSVNNHLGKPFPRLKAWEKKVVLILIDKD